MGRPRKYVKITLDALNKSIEMWEWLAETGRVKSGYFKTHLEKRPIPESLCYLCDGNSQLCGDAGVYTCRKCPLTDSILMPEDEFNDGCTGTYTRWSAVRTKKDRQREALNFLNIQKTLRSKIIKLV